jgi:serine phosphatase RsbU (regulator of sigma subunit)
MQLLTSIKNNSLAQHDKDQWVLSQLDLFAKLMLFKESQTIHTWGEHLLQHLVPSLNGVRAALYAKKEATLSLVAGYALEGELQTSIRIGEGIVGEVAKSRTKILLHDNDINFHLTTVAGTTTLRINSLLAIPLIFNEQLQGVLELMWVHTVADAAVELLERLSERIAATLNVIAAKEQLMEKNRDIEEKNANIIASINYAQRIQSAFLPELDYLQKVFPDSFLIYIPKDIVSGDFYWVSEHDNKKLVGVIDCTGHGVPGAFMSLIGHGLLSEAIFQQRILDPGEIVTYINNGIREKLLNRDKTFQDGMDLGLCLIEELSENHYSILYAGAKHVLFGVTGGKYFSLKSDRTAINSIKQNHRYTSTQLLMYKGDTLYLTTDGYLDQSNPQRKRIGTAGFQQLIEEYWKVSAVLQHKLFLKYLQEHQQHADQRDDITLLMLQL